MSGYPDPNYAPPDLYPSSVGESCENPKPFWFYKGANFCEDVTVGGNLNVESETVLNTLKVQDLSIEVDGLAYSSFLFLNNYDGRYYYVLANQLDKSFIPPPVTQ
jgi:hypothetical protein